MAATYTKPTDDPQWCTTGSRVDPGGGKRLTGWVAPELPPDTYFNFIQGVQGDFVAWLGERFDDGGTPETFIIKNANDATDMMTFDGTNSQIRIDVPLYDGLKIDDTDFVIDVVGSSCRFDFDGGGDDVLFYTRSTDTFGLNIGGSAAVNFKIDDGGQMTLGTGACIINGNRTHGVGALPGSTFGTSIRGASNGHVYVDIRNNDLNDGFHVINDSTGSAGVNPPDQLLFSVKSVGETWVNRRLVIDGSLLDATVAPLKLPPQATQSSIVRGGFWVDDGGGLWGGDGTNQHVYGRRLLSLITVPSVSGTTARTDFAGASVTFPANSLQVGDIVEIIFSAEIYAGGGGGSGTIQLGTRTNGSGTMLSGTSTTDPNTNTVFTFRSRMVIGAGSAIAMLDWTEDDLGSHTIDAKSVNVVFDRTAANTVTIFSDHTTTSPGVQLEVCTMRVF